MGFSAQRRAHHHHLLG